MKSIDQRRKELFSKIQRIGIDARELGYERAWAYMDTSGDKDMRPDQNDNKPQGNEK